MKGKRAPFAAPALFVALAMLFAAIFPASAQEIQGRYLINHDYRPSAGLAKTGWLSDYYPGLLGTPGDSKVYYFEGPAPGGTLFVGGGTHANEIAGLEFELKELENIFALLILGGFAGLPSPPSPIAVELLPYLERELTILLSRTDLSQDPLGVLMGMLEID